MITEASLEKRYFEGVPLLCEAAFCLYLCTFSTVVFFFFFFFWGMEKQKKRIEEEKK